MNVDLELVAMGLQTVQLILQLKVVVNLIHLSGLMEKILKIFLILG